MANFQTHITTSTVLGVGYAAAGHYLYDIAPAHCLVAGALCSIGGMLPDLDSDSGIPVREMLCFVSVLVPMLMLRRFEALGLTPELMVFAAGVMYVSIRFGVGFIFKRYTKHRGMWHSLPAAAIAGLITFLVCLSPELNVRIFKSWGMVLGFISHLVLDEIYSVDFRGRRLKKSAGTAMKFWGKRPWPNYSTYAKLIFLILLVMSDGVVMERFGAEPLEIPWTAWVDRLLDKSFMR
ncbi:metal-dependent hydrolase [bacterium]|nr:metal-dependent hydrolase [bacterium]